MPSHGITKSRPRRGSMSPLVGELEDNNLPKHFVATALMVRDDHILLIHHKKIGLWLPPGGHIETREDPVAALRREIREETGVEIEILSDSVDPRASDEAVQVLPLPHHIQIEHMADGHDHIDLVYLCRVRPGEAQRVEESLGLRWFSREDLASNDIVENVRYFGQQAIDEVAKREGRNPRRSSSLV